MRRGLEDGWKSGRHGASHIWKKFLSLPAPVGHRPFTGNGGVFRGGCVCLTTSQAYVNLHREVGAPPHIGAQEDCGISAMRGGGQVSSYPPLSSSISTSQLTHMSVLQPQCTCRHTRVEEFEFSAFP